MTERDKQKICPSDLSMALNQNMGMEGRDLDANASMRFVATENDTSVGIQRDSEALMRFNEILK